MSKRTPLYDEHVALGATMIPFGGWDMPVYYTSVIEEHKATRERAGLFDTSHMGEFDITGSGSFAFLDSLLAGNLADLAPGRAVYSPMTNERGGVVDDLWVYMIGADTYRLVVNASTAPKDLEWVVRRAAGLDVKVQDASAQTGMIALQGPSAVKIMALFSDKALPQRFRFHTDTVADRQVVVSRTGYTGEDGVELYMDAADTAHLWRSLLESGQPLGLSPVGLGARDTLRLEACYSLYGHELSEDITPAEAGITFAVARGKTFPGSDVVYEQMEQGPARKIVAFELLGRGIPRDGYPVLCGGKSAGHVTSGCFSPSLKKGIGLAMLDAAAAQIGNQMEVEIREKLYPAKIVKKPFVRNV